jgi:aminoglycoside/choline kinase family phosphotransferase
VSAAFLTAHGFGMARRLALAGDASARRYTRMLGGPSPALLMESPPGEGLDAFLALAAHLGGARLRAPRILAADPSSGLVLVEDLGAATMAELLDAGEDPAPLYREAAATLAALHAAPLPARLPRWAAEEMTRAAEATFLDWWWPACFGAPPSAEQRVAFRAAMGGMLAPFAPDCLTHRDFFPANLVPGEAGMGMIDFQDAALGHPAYDLVSLVEDARRDVAAALREATIRHYLALRPMADPAAAMAVMAAQRHLRVAALWVRLDRRDGKPQYLAHGPRCWALLDRALAHPASAPLARFLDAHVPREKRCNPC